jgi:hypothetical protein
VSSTSAATSAATSGSQKLTVAPGAYVAAVSSLILELALAETRVSARTMTTAADITWALLHDQLVSLSVELAGAEADLRQPFRVHAFLDRFLDLVTQRHWCQQCPDVSVVAVRQGHRVAPFTTPAVQRTSRRLPPATHEPIFTVVLPVQVSVDAVSSAFSLSNSRRALRFCPAVTAGGVHVTAHCGTPGVQVAAAPRFNSAALQH